MWWCGWDGTVLASRYFRAARRRLKFRLHLYTEQVLSLSNGSLPANEGRDTKPEDNDDAACLGVDQGSPRALAAKPAQ